MDRNLEQILAELEQFGAANDATAKEKPQKMLNITRDTGKFLDILIRSTRSTRILEIGTSNGYSTLWLANAARDLNGKVITLELLEAKAGMARENFARSGLSDWIDLRLGEAEEFLAANSSPFDIIFLDSNRAQYAEWWPLLDRTLKPGGLLVVDNAISHESEMAEFTRIVESAPAYASVIVPVGKGELLAYKAP